MLSPVSMEAPTPPPQPSPSAFPQRSPGISAYGYRQPGRFLQESPPLTEYKSPEFTVYGQKGVLSPTSTPRGSDFTWERSKFPEPAAASPMPSSKLNFEISSLASSAPSKPRSKVSDDDLALQRLVLL